mgnify:CR=1 FL=1
MLGCIGCDVAVHAWVVIFSAPVGVLDILLMEFFIWHWHWHSYDVLPTLRIVPQPQLCGLPCLY